ncbi:MAG: alpha-amylase family glycosyl hydrolase [Solirubrobacteraceae bacterium]|jgi:alpha-glucosidase
MTTGLSRWWDGATIYQVYVRSWRDSDGDGYGDLPGLIDRLDYLAWLGVDALWLSPIMPSPDWDWGYDVSDYTGVHPELGTLEDVDRLIAAAGDRGLAILLDLVPNHTSIEHPWFCDARSGRGARHRDWYVWADPGPSGGPPNNWLDSTGGPAWTLDAGSGQYYLHNFLATQPDLNWFNDEVHGAFIDIQRFWLDRGIAGFRIDVASGLYKDARLRDDPLAAVSPAAPFGRQRKYSKNRPEVHDVYRAWRSLAREYTPERLLLGETWVFSPDELARFYGQDDELQLAFNFAFAFAPFDADALSRVVTDTLASLRPDSCPVWHGSNHDTSRFPTRWCEGDPARVRLALVVLLTLPGTATLYYGDELGLPDVEIAPEDQRDSMTWRASDGRFNRDRARTPQPWSPQPGAGFTAAGVRPWLPLGDRAGCTVDDQRREDDSDLHLTRRLIALRRAGVGPRAVYATLPAPDGVWAYRSGSLVVAANFTADSLDVDLPEATPVLSSTTAGGAPARQSTDQPVRLGTWEALVATVEPTVTHPDPQGAFADDGNNRA